MGRRKNSKVSLSKRNSKNVSKRWEPGNISEVDLGISRPTDVSEVSITKEPSTSNDGQNHSANLDENLDDEPLVNKTGFALYDSYHNEIETDENATKYILVDAKQLHLLIGLFPCPDCLTPNSLSIKTTSVLGYANSFNISCNECDYYTTFNSSARLPRTTNTKAPPFDVNRRMVHTFSAMGKGLRGLEVFSMHFNMKAMQNKSYRAHKKALLDATTQNVEKNLEMARCEVRKANMIFSGNDTDLNSNEPLDITVSYDGSWHKRGFTSKYGVGCCIEMTTGLVIDFEVLSKYCRSCDIMSNKLKDQPIVLEGWLKNHMPNCEKNYDGSSPMMEVEAAERIWSRSLKHGFRYTTLISDGDSKTLSHLNSAKIYGDKEIEKIECINHVSKRLGTALRNLVKDNKKTGSKLGGKSYGSLKDTTITKLTTYYRNAIQNNIGSLDNMKKAVFATLMHCKSTDSNPQHNNCPEGDQSWCFYNKYLAMNLPPPPHETKIKTPLREDVVAKLMPIYQRLGSSNLLSRCVDGKTQNANEALHGVLWSKCPKTTFVFKSTVLLRVSEGICTYNCGYLKTISEIQQACGLANSPGTQTSKIAKRFDNVRLSIAKKRKNEKYQEYKRKKKMAIQREEETMLEREGTTYATGEF